MTGRPLLLFRHTVPECEPVVGDFRDAVQVDKRSSNHKAVEDLVALELQIHTQGSEVIDRGQRAFTGVKGCLQPLGGTLRDHRKPTGSQVILSGQRSLLGVRGCIH